MAKRTPEVITLRPLRKARASVRREELAPRIEFLNTELVLDPPDPEVGGDEAGWFTYHAELGEGLTASVWTHADAGGWLGTLNLHTIADAHNECELARVGGMPSAERASAELGELAVKALQSIARMARVLGAI